MKKIILFTLLLFPISSYCMKPKQVEKKSMIRRVTVGLVDTVFEYAAISLVFLYYKASKAMTKEDKKNDRCFWPKL